MKYFYKLTFRFSLAEWPSTDFMPSSFTTNPSPRWEGARIWKFLMITFKMCLSLIHDNDESEERKKACCDSENTKIHLNGLYLVSVFGLIVTFDRVSSDFRGHASLCETTFIIAIIRSNVQNKLTTMGSSKSIINSNVS